MKQVQGALSYHGHDYTWKQLYDRNGSFAMGWAQLGWPYTLLPAGHFHMLVDPEAVATYLLALISKAV